MVVLQKIENRSTIFLVYTQKLKEGPQREVSRIEHSYSWQHYLQVIRCKQPKFLSTDKEIDKMWYMPTMEFNSVFKRKGILANV
jgi:hypothetical protein